ncbi:MAG: NADPH-dependent F420 reductase, partial [Hyphococcus sp.]
MKIGIIGAGMVGGALTKAFAKRGHEIITASSNPDSDKMKALMREVAGNARAGTALDAAVFGDVIILATPWPKTQDIIQSLGDLGGKIVIDATNPIKADFSGLEFPDGCAGGEWVQAWAPSARVVKTLNQIGFELMDGPVVHAGKPVMFIAGDDQDAKNTVCNLVDSLGFESDDCG